MGTLQTEMEKTMQEWNQSHKSQAEIVFDYVSLNPSCSTNDVVANLNMSVSKASATLLGLFERGKLGRKAYPNPDKESPRKLVYHYWTEVDYYGQKGTSRKVTKKLGRPKKEVVSRVEEAVFIPRKEIPQEEMYKHNPETFVSNLTMREARALYDVLKSYFQ